MCADFIKTEDYIVKNTKHLAMITQRHIRRMLLGKWLLIWHSGRVSVWKSSHSCKRRLACTNLAEVRRVNNVTCHDSRLTAPALVMSLSATGLRWEQRFQFRNRKCEEIPGRLVSETWSLSSSPLNSLVTKIATHPEGEEVTFKKPTCEFSAHMCLLVQSSYVTIRTVSISSCQHLSTELPRFGFILHFLGTIFRLQCSLPHFCPHEPRYVILHPQRTQRALMICFNFSAS